MIEEQGKRCMEFKRILGQLDIAFNKMKVENKRKFRQEALKLMRAERDKAAERADKAEQLNREFVIENMNLKKEIKNNN